MKEIEIGKPVIVPEFSTWHLYAGPNEDSEGITYGLAHRQVWCSPDCVAPVEALTRTHEERAKALVTKNELVPAGTHFSWTGTLPTGKRIYSKTRTEARARVARMLAIIDYHAEDGS